MEIIRRLNLAIALIEFPVGIYLFKFNNRNTITRCTICSKLTIKTTENKDTIVNFENVIAGGITPWVLN